MNRLPRSRRSGRSRTVHGRTTRLWLEALEDRIVPSNSQWLTVIEGISPGETLEEQTQRGADVLLASGVADQDIHVVSAFDLSGSFLVQTAGDATEETLTNQLQGIPGFIFAQSYEAPGTPDQPFVPIEASMLRDRPDPLFGPFAPLDALTNNNTGSTGTAFYTQAETTIVANNNLVVTAYYDSGSNAGTPSPNKFTGYSVSLTGGGGFTDSGSLPANANGDAGDPVLARFNSFTTPRLYLSTLQFSGAGVNVFRSDNNGTSWLTPVQGAPGKTGLQDKPWITVDNFGGTGNGNVYLVERDFGAGNGIYFFRSTNGGSSFGPTGGTLIATGGQGAYVVVGADHAVYVFWYAGSTLQMRKSTNLGVSFGAPVTVATGLPTTTNGDLGLVGVNNGETAPRNIRSNAFIQVVANPNFTTPGLLYGTYASKGAGTDKADVFFVTSSNGGTTWSTPVKVNDDTTTNDQWMPTLAITSEGTQLGIFYYSRQEDTGTADGDVANNQFKLYGRLASINGTAVTFSGPSFAVSDVASKPEVGRDSAIAADFMGDYIQAAGFAGQFYIAWSDNRSPLPGGGTRMDPNVQFDRVLAPFTVTGSTPAAGAFVSTSLTSFTVTTSESIFTQSLQASDFKVNGVAATGVSYTPGSRTAAFTFSTSPMTVQGLQTMQIAAGAFTRNGDNTGVSAFTATFRWDAAPVSVAATHPPFPNGVFALPAPLTYDVTFNEAVDPASVQTTDLTLSGLSGATVTGVSVLPGNTTARFSIGGVSTEGTLTASIAADAITDSFGNAKSTAFSASYQADIGTTAFPTPLSAKLPLGALVYSASATGLYNFAGDTDSYTLNVGAGQTIALFVDPAGNSQPSATLRDPSGTVLGTMVASAGGQNALLQAVATTTGGSYTISVGLANGTTGNYTLEVTLNAALEVEDRISGAASNNTIGTAQDINGSFIGLSTPQASASRGAVTGRYRGTDDVYSFNLAAGETAMVGMAVTTPIGTNLFGPATVYGGHIGPRGLAFRDLNHDGHPDMVSANTSDPNNTVAIQLGNGDGTFGPVVNYRTNAAFLLRDVDVGDINGDGNQDIVVAAGNNAPVVSVLLGNGDGTFAGTIYAMGSGFSTGGIVVRDFNGDGRADVVNATYALNGLIVRLGQADGTLGPAALYAGAGQCVEIAAGDLNRDGWLDVVTTKFVSNQFSGVAVFLGNGAGGFSLLASVPMVVTFTGPSDLTLADFNNDGLLDLATSHITPANAVAVRLGTGDGTFGPLLSFSSGGDGNPSLLDAGDVNGDGNVDVAMGNDTSGNIGVLLGNGDGTFGTATTFATTGGGAGYVRLADLNHDGLPELCTTVSSGVSVRLNLVSSTRVQLLDGTGAVVQTGVLANSLRSVLTYTAPSDGTYYARVTSTGSQDYNMVVIRNAAFEMEPNSSATAQDLTGKQGVLGHIAATGAPTVTRNWIDSGWWDNTGFHDANNKSYFVGQIGFTGYRNFTVFDLSGLTQSIGAATLKLFNPANGYSSSDATETYDLRSVETPLATLRASGSGLGSDIYNDLGSSSTPSLGSVTLSSANNSSVVSIPISATGISALNASLGGLFAFGGTLNTLAVGRTQYVFQGSGLPSDTRQLVVTLASAEDWYTIDVTAGNTIFLETSTPGDAFLNTLNPHIDLYDPSGNKVASGTAYPDGRNEFIQYHPSVPGTYRVRVIREGNTSGEYFLTKNLRPVVSWTTNSPIDENGTLTVNGTITDDVQDSHTVSIGWGVGQGSTILHLDAGVTTFSASHQYLDDFPSDTFPGRYFVTVFATDNLGVSHSTSRSVTVNNVEPVLTALTPVAGINENDTYVLTGTFHDDGTLDTHVVVINWGPGEGSTTLTTADLTSLGGGDWSFSASHQYLDDNLTGTSSDLYTIFVTVTDDDGGTGGGSTSVTVNNLVPAVAPIAGPTPSPGVRGQALSFSSSFTDVGTLDTHQATWNFGDGTGDFGPTSATQGTTFTTSHVFTASGTYTVALTVQDDDGGVTVVTHDVTIVDLALQDDPANPGQTMLVVGGTSGDDTIHFSPVGNTGAIEVVINGVAHGTFSPTSRFIVYAQDGNDNVQVAGSIDLSAWLYGGGGDDQLNGGAGNNVLNGGDGDDHLLGGPGRDLMIGGNGADRLVGNGADDILIGAGTLFDDNEAALWAVMAEWGSDRDYDTRVANLRGLGTGPRLNGNTFLTMDGPGATVLDDGVSDTLTASSGFDWFFAHLGDVVTGRHSGEELG
jgi:hypothetical protein